MKQLPIYFLLLLLLPSAQPYPGDPIQDLPVHSKGNLIIVTIDGFRWQELFTGADESLISDPVYTPDTSTAKLLYWSDNENERRHRLMPFFWNIISRKGRLYGNRRFDNKVNTSNLYTVSYPGYNEIFSGGTDLLVSSNKKKLNDNTNVLEYLNTLEPFKGQVVAFTSWDVFPFILNERRSGMLVNAGYEPNRFDSCSDTQDMIDRVQSESIVQKSGTRYDQLTMLAAREYLQQRRPRVVLLGLGETDEFAHRGRYDLYLQQANNIDRMIGELWQWVQTTPGYKDNTTLLITTDHGRGSRDSKWTSHSSFIRGSSQTWLAMIGPGIAAFGEMKERQQLYQRQLAGTIAGLVGENFASTR